MMSERLSIETPKKVRSVRFNDDALETIVSYNIDDMYINSCPCDDRNLSGFPDDAMRLYRRSGSHESLYGQISVEMTSMNPKLLKKRSSDLDDSNHFRSSHHSYHNATFDTDMISSNDFNSSNDSSHQRSFVSHNSGLRFHCRGEDDNDLDVSRHNRQQRQYNKKVMCV
jgi:hypothetical protein